MFRRYYFISSAFRLSSSNSFCQQQQQIFLPFTINSQKCPFSSSEKTSNKLPSTTSSSQQQQQQQQKLAKVKTTALKLNGYVNLHKSNVNVSKTRIVLQAWREIEDLPQEYLENADLDSVVKMMTAFSYFRRYWENGHLGPANPLPTTESNNNNNSRKFRDAEEIDIPSDFFYSSLSGSSSSVMNGSNGRNSINIQSSSPSNLGPRSSTSTNSSFINQKIGRTIQGNNSIISNTNSQKTTSNEEVGNMIE